MKIRLSCTKLHPNFSLKIMTSWPLSNHPQKATTLIKGGGGLRCKIPCFTWTGSNMPQGMLIGVPEGGSTSGIGRWGRRVERGGWEVI